MLQERRRVASAEESTGTYCSLGPNPAVREERLSMSLSDSIALQRRGMSSKDPRWARDAKEPSLCFFIHPATLQTPQYRLSLICSRNAELRSQHPVWNRTSAYLPEDAVLDQRYSPRTNGLLPLPFELSPSYLSPIPVSCKHQRSSSRRRVSHMLPKSYRCSLTEILGLASCNVPRLILVRVRRPRNFSLGLSPGMCNGQESRNSKEGRSTTFRCAQPSSSSRTSRRLPDARIRRV